MKAFFKTLWDYWMKFAHVVGEVNQYILLGIVYFVVIGIYAILAWPFRWFAKKPKTTWVDSPKTQTVDQLTRPF